MLDPRRRSAGTPLSIFMFVPLLVLRNAFRHRLRTTLTIVGIIVAITAFGLLRTIVDAWYAGAEASSSARLITRSSVSLVFSLPLNYAQKIRQVEGVSSVAWANWFGGVYVSERNFFAQFAISGASYLDMSWFRCRTLPSARNVVAQYACRHCCRVAMSRPAAISG